MSCVDEMLDGTLVVKTVEDEVLQRFVHHNLVVFDVDRRLLVPPTVGVWDLAPERRREVCRTVGVTHFLKIT